MSVSIVMPCYNESDSIENVVKSYYSNIIVEIEDSELIVIDDCSRDNSRVILEKLAVEYPKLRVLKTTVNSGHGKTIRKGYASASKKYIFQVDSDAQFEPSDFWKLYALKDKYDFILGVRRERSDPAPRILLTKIVGIINLLIFGVWIKDANCPFRLMKKETLDKVLGFIPREALAPNLMLTLAAKKNGVKMFEVPVSHFKRNGKAASVSNWKLLKIALKGFQELLVWKIAKRRYA